MSFKYCALKLDSRASRILLLYQGCASRAQDRVQAQIRWKASFDLALALQLWMLHLCLQRVRRNTPIFIHPSAIPVARAGIHHFLGSLQNLLPGQLMDLAANLLKTVQAS